MARDSCSLCGKGKQDVERLIVGLHGAVCSDCVRLCGDIVGSGADDSALVSSERSAEVALCQAAAALMHADLIGASEGNISCRLPEGGFIATPAGFSKGDLSPRDLVTLGPEGAPLSGGRPSSEIGLHLRIYEARPDCEAIVHAHPPTATGFALARRTIPAGVLPESDVVLGPVALVPFAIPGSAGLGKAAAHLAKDHDTLLLEAHGAVTLGASLREAAERMETLERVARMVLAAELLGGAQPLPAEALEWIRKVREGGR